MPHVVWFLMKDVGLLSEFLCWMWGWVGSKVGMIREANAAGLGRHSLILIEEMEIKTKPFILAQQIWLIILFLMIIPICLLTLMMVIAALKSWMFQFISILDKLCGGIQFCCVCMLLPVCSPTPEPDLQRKMTFWWSNCSGRGFASTKNSERSELSGLHRRQRWGREWRHCYHPSNTFFFKKTELEISYQGRFLFSGDI